MTFEEWWKSHFGNTPIADDVGAAAVRAWDAAVAAERGRCGEGGWSRRAVAGGLHEHWHRVAREEGLNP